MAYVLGLCQGKEIRKNMVKGGEARKRFGEIIMKEMASTIKNSSR